MGQWGLVEDGGGHLDSGRYGEHLRGPDHDQRRDRVLGQSYTAPGPATGSLGSGPITLGNGTLVLAGSTDRHDLRPDFGQRLDPGGEQQFDHRRQPAGGRRQRGGDGGGHGHLADRGRPDVEPGHDQRLYAGFCAELAVQQQRHARGDDGQRFLGGHEPGGHSSGTFTAVNGGTLGLAGVVGSAPLPRRARAPWS